MKHIWARGVCFCPAIGNQKVWLCFKSCRSCVDFSECVKETRKLGRAIQSTFPVTATRSNTDMEVVAFSCKAKGRGAPEKPGLEGSQDLTSLSQRRTLSPPSLVQGAWWQQGSEGTRQRVVVTHCVVHSWNSVNDRQLDFWCFPCLAKIEVRLSLSRVQHVTPVTPEEPSKTYSSNRGWRLPTLQRLKLSKQDVEHSVNWGEKRVGERHLPQKNSNHSLETQVL